VARQKRQGDLTSETLNRLLDWLDHDRDRAGQRYEQIRSRLIKIFECRGCTAAEDLADETINRVAEKTQQIAGSYVGDPASYFCGVAHKIYLEHVRRVTSRLTTSAADVAETREPLPEEADVRYRCMEQCMERMSMQNRDLILAYYGAANGPQDKIARRKELSQRLGIGANALWIRTHRIREGLKKCVKMCVDRRRTDHSGDIE